MIDVFGVIARPVQVRPYRKVKISNWGQTITWFDSMVRQLTPAQVSSCNNIFSYLSFCTPEPQTRTFSYGSVKLFWTFPDTTIRVFVDVFGTVCADRSVGPSLVDIGTGWHKIRLALFNVIDAANEYASEYAAIEMACSLAEVKLREQTMADIRVQVRDVIDRLC